MFGRLSKSGAKTTTSKTAETVVTAQAPKSKEDLFTMDKDTVDVFLSVHVASLGPVAAVVKQALERQGKTVFLCTDLPAGVNYRNEITNGVKACKVFVPFMNNEWASSGECESEFLLAKRLNLTSHERKATSPPQARRPIFLPVAFPNLNPWSRFPHVELLASSTNFLLAPTDKALDDRMVEMVTSLAAKLCSQGSDVNSLIVTQGDATQVNFGSLRAALDALDVYLNQATTILAGANALSAKAAERHRQGQMERMFANPKGRYIGFTYGRVTEHVETVFSLELNLSSTTTLNNKLLSIDGSVVYKICSVTVGKGFNETFKEWQAVQGLVDSCTNDSYAELTIKGTFSSENGLLMVDDDEVIHDTTGFTKSPQWTKDSYRLLVSSDGRELTGTLRGWGGHWDIAFRAEAF